MIHISYEAGVLEDANYEPDRDMFKKTKDPEDAPDRHEQIIIEFRQGFPVMVKNLSDGIVEDDTVGLF